MKTRALSQVFGLLVATASAFLGGRSGSHLRNPRLLRHVRASAGGYASRDAMMYEGARIGPPPDLPSLLLHNRIVYIGMPLVPAVTELIIAELLYLNYESSDKVRELC